MTTQIRHSPEDRAIIATADDAILAKLAAVKAGYYQDPYIEALSQHASGIARGGRTHRQVQPIIKRGTHARVCCVDRAIADFIDFHSGSGSNRDANTTTTMEEAAVQVQVVVLGCGKDTAYFRHGQPHVRWYEVDHPLLLKAKASILQSTKDLFLSKVQPTEYGYSVSTTKPNSKNNKIQKDETTTTAATTTTTTCHLVGHDLRGNPQLLMDKLMKNTGDFDANAPTLFLFECVLMYMPDDASRALLQCLAQPSLPQAYICCYEPILGSDSFGKMMERNLCQAGVGGLPDSCLRQTRTLDAQLDKLISTNCSDGGGFTRAVGCDMSQAYEAVMTQEQRSQANQCEFLDEVEEWLMIMRHYCFVVASTVATHGNETNDFAEYFCGVGPNSALGFIEGKCASKSK